MNWRSILIAVVVLIHGIPSSAAAQNWKDLLKERLVSTITLTEASTDRLRITKPGTVLTVQQPGITAGLGTDNLMLRNHLRDGQIQGPRGVAAALARKDTNRDYEVGEKVYVQVIDVNDNDIALGLLTVGTSQVLVSGNTRQTRYKAVLAVDFPRNSLREMDFERVMETIGIALAFEGAAPEPATVELGQTFEQVEAVLGKPTTILRAEDKVIYVYPAFKVTFVGGVVAEIG